MIHKPCILCVDDDEVIIELVRSTLAQSLVLSANDIKSALKIINESNIDCFIIDVNLPDGSGYNFLTTLQNQEKYKQTPVLIFSDNTEVNNKIAAFSLGADDFIDKPFNPLELRARVFSKIQKKIAADANINERVISDLKFDLDKQKVLLIKQNQENDLKLTFHEMKILILLSKSLDRVYSRQQILDEVWPDTHISDRTIDSHIAHLRKKISNSKLGIKTVKNVGYKLTLEST